jgi:hypothetical protein
VSFRRRVDALPVEAYGKFVEEPTRPELERFFFLDDVGRDLIGDGRTRCGAGTSAALADLALAHRA